MLRSKPTRISFNASDGYPLVGTLYEPSESMKPSRVALVNCGAGIPASYYGRFAGWLAGANIPTLTYDYRGVGLSRPATLVGFSASVEDWGSKDCASAILALSERYPGTPISVVGHSIGCFLTGFVNWRPEIDRMLFIAPHTGYYGDYAPIWRSVMWLAWHFLMPAVTRCVGYFPGRLLRLPEDLPRGVAIEWADRRRPEFWWNLRTIDGTLNTELRDRLLDRFAAFQGAVLAIRASDDAFSTFAGSKRVSSLYANLKWKEIEITSSQSATANIGHFGYFRSRARGSLWPLALTWLRDERCDGAM